MQDLTIAIIQSDLKWEDSHYNLDNFDKKIDLISQEVDLIVLPEMFNTGFSINPVRCAQTMDGEAVQWMREKASQQKCCIAGSIFIGEDGKFFNRLFVFYPDGTHVQYDKRHRFRLADEVRVFSAGTERVEAKIKGWKIMLSVCYDLRFPVWFRNRFVNGEFDYDILLNVANWPQIRSYQWKQLLLARAIENQSVVIGLNRVGFDGNQVFHSGNSMVVDAQGFPMVSLDDGIKETSTIRLSYSDLDNFRKKFPFYLDWDEFSIS